MEHVQELSGIQEIDPLDQRMRLSPHLRPKYDFNPSMGRLEFSGITRPQNNFQIKSSLDHYHLHPNRFKLISEKNNVKSLENELLTGMLIQPIKRDLRDQNRHARMKNVVEQEHKLILDSLDQKIFKFGPLNDFQKINDSIFRMDKHKILEESKNIRSSFTQKSRFLTNAQQRFPSEVVRSLDIP